MKKKEVRSHLGKRDGFNEDRVQKKPLTGSWFMSEVFITDHCLYTIRLTTPYGCTVNTKTKRLHLRLRFMQT